MSRSPLWRGVALLSLVLFFVPAQAADLTPPQKAYLEGVVAYNGGDYSGAVAKMQEALRSDGAEGVNKFKSSNYKQEDYLPHYYLGLSLEKLGQAEPALREMQESVRQGAIRERPDRLRILEPKLQRLQASLAPKPPTPTTPPVAVAVATRPASVPTAAAAAAPTQAPQPTAVAAVRPTPTPGAPLFQALPTPVPSIAGEPASPRPGGLSPDDTIKVRQGIRFYFNGDYRSAVTKLEPLAANVPVARLFLAYALVAGELLTARPGAETLDRARKEYEKALAAGAPSGTELISPSVLKALKPS